MGETIFPFPLAIAKLIGDTFTIGTGIAWRTGSSQLLLR
jgi:hypothetical protein